MPKIKINASQLISCSKIRSDFAKALSDMYRFEVPLYGTLLDMVKQLNQQELDENPALLAALEENKELKLLNNERHAAIRLGKAEELSTIRRLFAVMGMFPVSYYDLTEAGLAVHSTAFRPLQADELNRSPFRIFTSLLRLDLIQDEKLKVLATALLSRRKIFSDNLIQLIELHERQEGLNTTQAQQFVAEAMHTFRWHFKATINKKTYQLFLKEHSLLADIVCFKGPHINHLTPRILNIDKAQQLMPQYGLKRKEIIEGPPHRKYPILLRQTSFKAVKEDIQFPLLNNDIEMGSHSARFGEIEQRGMALTPKGRALYDRLLNEVRQAIPDAVNHVESYYQQLTETFQQFPDDLIQLQKLRLAYFTFHINPDNPPDDFSQLDTLITDQKILLQAVTYEDFLPVSAAGIFQSNLGNQQSESITASFNQQRFEQDLGCAVISEFEYYEKIQIDSLRACLQSMKVDEQQQTLLIKQLLDS